MAAKKSIVTDDMERCYWCGRQGVMNIHHALSGSYRKVADKEGLTVPLCIQCHNMVHSSKGSEIKKIIARRAQEAWEQKYPERDFIQVIGRSFK